MVQEEDELLSSYSFAWLLTGDFRLAKGDVKRSLAFRVWASNLPVVRQRFLRLRKVYIEKMVANV